MIARPQSATAEQWYSLQELASKWRVHRVTVRKWLGALRKQGRGPVAAQQRTYFYYGAKRDLQLRDDYVRVMEQAFLMKG